MGVRAMFVKTGVAALVAGGVGSGVSVLHLTGPASASIAYHVINTGGDGVRARTAPRTNAPWSYGAPERATVAADCQTWGDAVGPNGNRLWHLVHYNGKTFYAPDRYLDTPTVANRPVPGEPMCGAAQAAPAPAAAQAPPRPAAAPTGRADVSGGAIAAEALRYATGGYNEQAAGAFGGQCREFVNNVVARVSSGRVRLGGEPWDYNAGFRRVGAYQIPSAAAAARGDIVQQGATESDPRLHTYIIVANKGGGRFEVVDSNHGSDNKVRHYDRTFSVGTVWRLGRP